LHNPETKIKYIALLLKIHFQDFETEITFLVVRNTITRN